MLSLFTGSAIAARWTVGLLSLGEFPAGETTLTSFRVFFTAIPILRTLAPSQSNFLSINFIWVPSTDFELRLGRRRGKPLELPFTVSGTETTQVVGTCWVLEEIPIPGIYIVLFEGTGSIELQGSAEAMEERKMVLVR